VSADDNPSGSRSANYSPSPNEAVRAQVRDYEETDGQRGGEIGGAPVVILTTIGRRTGMARKTPLIRVSDGTNYAVVASLGGAPSNPLWYWNVVEHPMVTLQDKAHVATYVARELRAEERELWWQRALLVWPEYGAYATRTARLIPIFALEPVEASSKG
jgi:deazaflavin-dependent oxidoreductase (nitroreductase family)